MTYEDRTHECPAPGCPHRVPRSQLACREHWFALSTGTRDAVWQAWRNGRGEGSPEHRAAVQAAVAALRGVSQRTQVGIPLEVDR